MSYWLDRITKAQNSIADRTERDIQKKLKKYYEASMRKVISDFEATYDKLQASMEDGREPTPADLYKLDKYWQMQGQLKNELQKLGDQEVALLSKEFERVWKDIYEATALPSQMAFSTMATNDVKAVVNDSWLPDGKNFSQRIWGNTEKLAETLNDNLLHCVQTGKDTKELKELLQNRFNVSYNSASTLVRTETAHIQTQAASQRYQDYGLKYYEFLADPDERTCDRCGALDRKKFLYSEMVAGKNAPPMHPNDRCTIIPVIDNESEENIMKNEFTKECNRCGKEFTTTNNNIHICSECQSEVTNQLKAMKKSGIPNSTYKVFEEAWMRGGAVPVDKVTHYKRRCYKCGKLFDSLYPTGNVICTECENKKDDIELATCTECGTFFVRNKKGKNKTMCDDCYEEHRRKYKAQKAKEYRAKKKATK